MNAIDPVPLYRLNIRHSLVMQGIQESDVFPHIVQTTPARAPGFGSQHTLDLMVLQNGSNGRRSETTNLATTSWSARHLRLRIERKPFLSRPASHDERDGQRSFTLELICRSELIQSFFEIGGHMLGDFRTRRLGGGQNRFQNVLCDMSDHWNHEAVPGQVVSLVVVLRQLVIFGKPHQPRRLARGE